MANGKPLCGRHNATVDKDLTTILLIVGAVTGILGAVKGSAAIAEWLAAQGLSVGVPFAALGAALITFGVVAVMYHNRCSTREGLPACSAGVISKIVPSFDSTVDQFFAFTAMHDRADVVVKSVYWPLVENNVFVRCSTDAEQSPVIASYFHTPEVCDAGAGAVIGAMAGVVAGTLLGIAAGVAIGCATVVLCLVAIIVAALVAATVVVAAAIIGGQIGRQVGGGGGGAVVDDVALQVGDYVTTPGELLNIEFLDGARAYWFATEATLHGRSTASPPFIYTDPDTNLERDACPMPGPRIL